MLSTLRQPLIIPAARHKKLYLHLLSAEHEASEQETVTKVHAFAQILTVPYRLAQEHPCNTVVNWSHLVLGAACTHMLE